MATLHNPTDCVRVHTIAGVTYEVPARGCVEGFPDDHVALLPHGCVLTRVDARTSDGATAIVTPQDEPETLPVEVVVTRVVDFETGEERWKREVVEPVDVAATAELPYAAKLQLSRRKKQRG